MRLVGAVLFGLSMAGCKDLNEGAREDFSRAHTCPMDRVEARERADIRPSSLRYGEDKPPAEIAADPGRLKMWQDERTKDRQDYDSSNKTFEVRGCGHLLSWRWLLRRVPRTVVFPGPCTGSPTAKS